MADSREYVVQKAEEGTLHISEDVLSTVAALAAADVEGVGKLIDFMQRFEGENL